MRKAAVILPDLGTSPDTPIVVGYWIAAAGRVSGRGSGWSKYWSGPRPSMSPRRRPALVEIRLREDDPILPGAMLGCIAVLDKDSDDESKDKPDPGSDDPTATRVTGPGGQIIAPHDHLSRAIRRRHPIPPGGRARTLVPGPPLGHRW